MTGQFSEVGNFVAQGADHVNPALVDILQEAANRIGVKVEAYSGYRPGDPRFHGKGMATDVRIIGADGKPIPNYQDAGGFSAYEKLAQEARKVQMEKYPSLAQNFRWGGYFGGPKGKYGAMDTMHFDLGGSAHLGMAGGSWEKGLTETQASRFPGAKSRGLGMMALVDGAQDKPTFDPTAFGAVALDAPAPAAAPAQTQAAFAPDQPASPAANALDNLVQPVAAQQPMPDDGRVFMHPLPPHVPPVTPVRAGPAPVAPAAPLPVYEVQQPHKPVPFVPPQAAQPTPIAAGDGGGADLFAEAQKQFPAIAGKNIAFTKSPGANSNGNMLEAWPPGEPGTSDYPRPKDLPMGQYGIQVFSDDTKPSDVAALVISHFLVKTDPALKAQYDKFAATFSAPDRQARLKEDYEYSKKNEGETRPFKEWAEQTRIPDYFRGYVFNQWPDKAKQGMFNDGQRTILDQMSSSLKGTQGGANAQPAFDPVAAGAVPFDPAQFGAVPLGTTPTMVNPETNQPAGVPAYVPPGVAGYDPQTGNVTMGPTGTAVTAMAEGVPIVGPLLDKGVVNASAGIGSLISGEPFGQVKDEMQTRLDQSREDNPTSRQIGNGIGALTVLGAAGTTATGAKLLGMSGNSLLGRMGMSAASNGMMSAADTAARGGTLEDVIKSGAYGTGIGAALPGAGAVVNAIARPVIEAVGPRVNALVRPAYEGARRVGQALGIDAKNAAAPVLNQADEAAAAVNNQKLLNVDRGGETTRALARSAANQDPEARAIIDKTVSDRFASQGDRAQSFIGRIMGGATDDLALQDSLKSAARASNKPAYEKAFNAPAAQDMFTPGLKDLLASPAIRQAAKDAETRGANRAVVEGFNPVRNPFVFDEAGQATLRSNARPTLQFWDQVKRNLDAEIGKASRGGDNTLVADLSALKSKLTSELDNAVPEYASARRGAAAFFGAEDALDAGKKFVTQNRTIPETRRALAQMSPAERSTFAVGFASELKDSIAQSGDRTNVINKIFGSQQARDKIEAALGPQAFREFEQFVRVEHSMDMLRGAMGNSTTARQLMEMGMAGGVVGGGTFALTGDWKSGMTAAILTGIARKGGAKIDEKVTKRIAELLLSDDPKAIQQAVTIASNSPKAAAAVEAIQSALSVATKASGNLATRPSDQAGDPRP